MSKKNIVILGVGALVLCIFAGAVFFMIWNKISAMENSLNTGDQTVPAEEPVAEPAMRPLLPLNAFIVNLAGEDGRRYLKIKLELELAKESHTEEIRQRIPQIRDSVMMILTSKHFKDIKDTEGKTALRQDILNRLNGLFKEAPITNIYFTDFVIQ